jgi:hypothetical protein
MAVRCCLRWLPTPSGLGQLATIVCRPGAVSTGMVTWATNQPTTSGIEVSTSAVVVPRVAPSSRTVTLDPGLAAHPP